MEGMADLNHDISFILYEFLFFVFGDEIFTDDFHGIELTVSFESC